jgi:hypothetical protein
MAGDYRNREHVRTLARGITAALGITLEPAT